jgi:hypothetical protein
MILCVADLIDPYVFSPLVKERFPKVDAVLCAGDVPAEYVDFLASALGKPVLFVTGSHPFSPESAEASGAVNVEYRCVKVKAGEKTLLVAGAPEAASSFRLLALYPALLWNRLRYGRALDVFLSHAPPLGAGDRPDCPGLPCFRTFIERFRPAWHAHGKIHLFGPRAERVTARGKTRVVNASGYWEME